MFLKEVKEILCSWRVWFIFGGAVLGVVETWVFAFKFYGMPATTSGLDGVAWVLPIGVLSGGAAGATVAYFAQRKAREK
jgi:hypothetical protein